MKRKYPAKMFIFGVFLNFLIRHFYLFLPGVILCVLGIWSKTCLSIGLALLILDLIISVSIQLRIRHTALSDSDNPEFNQIMDALLDPDNPEDLQKILETKMEAAGEAPDHGVLEKLVVYRTLRDSIHEGMTPEEMIDAFREMCRIPVGEPDDLLFESGTYKFTGEKLFYFSLVRQFQFLDEDEYVQLRLDLTYKPDIRTFGLRNTDWGSLTEGDFFQKVKSSPAYRAVKELPVHQVNVRIEET